MQRREFIAGLGGAAAWPLAARAQQGDRVRRIGMLLPYDENDPLMKTGFSALTQALASFGWTDGRNVRMDVRWGGGDINRIRALAQELVGLQPDIIVSSGTPAAVAAQRETRTIPIVFASVADPVAQRPRRTARPPERGTSLASSAYRPRLGTTYRRFIGHLTLPGTIGPRCTTMNASGMTTRPPPGSRPRAMMAVSISTSL
jgi:putative ABC transport system substrate-binding protein